MKLNGTKSNVNNGDRLSLMKEYLKVCFDKVNHIDGLRQRNMSIALIIFAVLFGFGLRTDGILPALFTAIGLVIMMTTFCLLDRRLHKMSHGWRATGQAVFTELGQAINSPEEPVEFHRYVASAEKKAELFALQPVLYYLLIAGSGLSFLAFLIGGSDATS